jgi:hypothetical protein
MASAQWRKWLSGQLNNGGFGNVNIGVCQRKSWLGGGANVGGLKWLISKYHGWRYGGIGVTSAKESNNR